jgi:hypothetical protein
MKVNGLDLQLHPPAFLGGFLDRSKHALIL